MVGQLKKKNFTIGIINTILVLFCVSGYQDEIVREIITNLEKYLQELKQKR